MWTLGGAPLPSVFSCLVPVWSLFNSLNFNSERFAVGTRQFGKQTLTDWCVEALSSSSANLSVHPRAFLLFGPSVITTVVLSSAISGCSLKNVPRDSVFVEKRHTLTFNTTGQTVEGVPKLQFTQSSRNRTKRIVSKQKSFVIFQIFKGTASIR